MKSKASTPDYPPGTTERILELQQQGRKRKDIAVALGVDINKVASDIQRFGSRLSDEQRRASHRLYDDAVRQEALRLRRAGNTVEEICIQTGLSNSTILYWCTQAKVVLTSEQKSANARKIDHEKAISLRREGVPLSEIAAKIGTTRGGIKSVLAAHAVTVEPEVRQRNAWAGRLARDPDPMVHTRMGLTPEVVARRSDSIRKRYAEDQGLIELKTRQIREWWHSLSESDRKEYLDKRHIAFLNSPAVKAHLLRLALNKGDSNFYNQSILDKSALDSMADYYKQLAESHGGEMVGEYGGSHEKTEWKCGTCGHTWPALPNSIQQGSWCPHCAHTGPSKAQLEIAAYVKSILPGEEVIVDDKTVLQPYSPDPSRPRHLDVYVPSLKKAIEFDGWFWHKSSWAIEREIPERDAQKDIQCQKAGVNLLRIDELDFEFDSKSELEKVASFLKS